MLFGLLLLFGCSQQTDADGWMGTCEVKIKTIYSGKIIYRLEHGMGI